MAKIFQGVLVVFMALAIAVPCFAGEPTNQIKDTTDKILAVLTGSGSDAEKRDQVRKAVDERFDWKEMSMRALAQHWRQRTDQEKEEFTDLFGKLLEQTYMDRIQNYSGEQVAYVGETIDGDYATVAVTITTSADIEIPVEYRLKKKGDKWMVYDISIEGVSLINNYRTQFRSLIPKYGYKKVVKMLQKKVR